MPTATERNESRARRVAESRLRFAFNQYRSAPAVELHDRFPRRHPAPAPFTLTLSDFLESARRDVIADRAAKARELRERRALPRELRDAIDEATFKLFVANGIADTERWTRVRATWTRRLAAARKAAADWRAAQSLTLEAAE